MGTHEASYCAAVYVESVQSIQEFQIANLEEIAFRSGWISADQLEETIGRLCKTSYAQDMTKLLADPGHKNLNACVAS